MSVREPDGGLRDRLVEVGVHLVTERGVNALSLREVARRAGVSHGAPRRHFPTHLDLLSAIAHQGLADLSATIDHALAQAPDTPRDHLTALGHAYVDHALTHQGMFELMVRYDLLSHHTLGLRGAGPALFDTLSDLVARERGLPPDQARITAGALWAGLHGVAHLWMWGGLGAITRVNQVEPLIHATLDAHLGPPRVHT